MLMEEVSEEEFERQKVKQTVKTIESQLFKIFESYSIPMTYRCLFKKEPRYYVFSEFGETADVWDNYPRSHTVVEIQLDKKIIKVLKEMFYAPMKIWGEQNGYNKLIKGWKGAN